MIKDDGSVIHFTNPKGESNIPLSFVKLEGMPLKEGVLHVTNGRQRPVRDEILHKPGEMEFDHLGEKDCW